MRNIIKIQNHIEIVRSDNPRLSSLSLVSCMAIYRVLKRHYTKVGITTVDYFLDLEKISHKNPDLVFIGMNFVDQISPNDNSTPVKVWLTDFLDQHDIAYTGSAGAARKLEVDKALAKQRAIDSNLRTSAFYVERGSETDRKEEPLLRYPLFVKPANRGGGVGIDSDSIVHTPAALDVKVRSIRKNQQADSLIEEYLSGREFSVAILKDEHSVNYFVMPIELIAPPDINGARILSSKVKSADGENHRGVIDESIKTKINRLALDVFKALGARDYGRIDIRLDRNGIPNFIEANLTPSLIDNYGSFPKACALNIDMRYEQMILSIVGLALGRAGIIDDDRPLVIAVPSYGQTITV